jgi:hypothetical protein
VNWRLRALADASSSSRKLNSSIGYSQGFIEDLEGYDETDVLFHNTAW